MELEIEIEMPKSNYTSFVESVESPLTHSRVLTADARIDNEQSVSFRVTESESAEESGAEIVTFVVRMFDGKPEVLVYLESNYDDEPDFHWRAS